MTPDQFKAMYGKALAGEESWADAAKNAKATTPAAGKSAGGKAVSQAKTHHAESTQGAPSQADTTPVAPPPPAASVPKPPPPEAPKPPVGAKPDYAEDLAHPPREPLYSALGGAQGIESKFDEAGMAGTRALGQGLSEVPDRWKQMAGATAAPFLAPAVAGAKLGASLGQPIGEELAFQAKPIVDEAEAYRQKLMAMLRGSDAQ